MERIVAATVRRGDEGVPLIDWLTRRFTYLDRGDWEAYIATGAITVDGKGSFPGRPLVEGDRVAFTPPASAAEPETEHLLVELYEDDNFLVVNKGPNLPCHPSGRFFRGTLWHLLADRFPTVHIATRLDRETTGCVLVCKTSLAARYAQGLLEAHRLTKSYLALVHGDFPPALEARGTLVPDPGSQVRKKRAFLPGEAGSSGGEACQTNFSVVSRSSGLSLVRAIPVTGRTHQIRATLSSLGYPLVGDKLYGTDETRFLRFVEGTLTAEDREALLLDHQALHCEELSFPTPEGPPLRVSAPPPWADRFSGLL